jgi:hypothetical protein
MTKTWMKSKPFQWIGICFACVIIFSGCSYFSSDQKDQDSASKSNKNRPLYYDFGDVLVPKELEVDRAASFVHHTPEYSAGVLVLTGRVEINSLIAFFENNMQRDNWKTVASFKSARTMMLFKKENRWCIISVADRGVLSTYVEIWVAPTAGSPSNTEKIKTE